MSNFEVDALNRSDLGVTTGFSSQACIAAADDEVLLSDTPFSLQSLLNLTEKFCKDACMKLVPSKTHLPVFKPKRDKQLNYWSLINPIKMGNKYLPFDDIAEHVGVIRSSSGSNLPAVASHISAHRKSLFHVLSCGAARGHS